MAQAVSSNTLYELFIGESSPQHCLYADVPTDVIAIFDRWLPYVASSDDAAALWKEFEATVVRIAQSAELSWFSLYYLSTFLDHMNRHGCASGVEVQTFVDKIVNNLILKKDVLSEDYRWMGSRTHSYSLWDDVVGRIRKFSKEYPYDFKVEQFVKSAPRAQ